jgi:hypothetical protein
MENKEDEMSSIGRYISLPFMAALEAQDKMIDKYLETVKKIAWEDGKENGKTNLLKFFVNKIFKKGNGNVETRKMEVEAPLLSLVKIPALTMKRVTVDLNLQLKDLEGKAVSLVSNDTVQKSPDQPSNKNSSDSNYKIHAEREGEAAGMSKLIDILSKSMDPIDVSSKK